jgi:hypothetical protein
MPEEKAPEKRFPVVVQIRVYREEGGAAEIGAARAHGRRRERHEEARGKGAKGWWREV